MSTQCGGDGHQSCFVLCCGSVWLPLMSGCNRNTNKHSMPHRGQRMHFHDRGENNWENRMDCTSKATTDILSFLSILNSTHYIACPFSEILKCHKNVSPSLSVAIPGQVLLTFEWILFMLSAINGDLCLEDKAFDFPQPEENRLSAIYFKSQIHIGVLFFFISCRFYLLHSLCGGVI